MRRLLLLSVVAAAIPACAQTALPAGIVGQEYLARVTACGSTSTSVSAGVVPDGLAGSCQARQWVLRGMPLRATIHRGSGNNTLTQAFAANVLASPEFALRNLTIDRASVDAPYRIVLLRAPSEQEIAFMTGAPAAVWNRTSLAMNFVRSKEFRLLQGRARRPGTHAALLGHSPQQAERAALRAVPDAMMQTPEFRAVLP